MYKRSGKTYRGIRRKLKGTGARNLMVSERGMLWNQKRGET